MEKSVFAVLFILFFSTCSFAYDGGHDSLIFDGASRLPFDNAYAPENCYIQVKAMYGPVKGTVIRCNVFYSVCEGGYIRSCTFEEDTQLKIGDTLMEGTDLEVGTGDKTFAGIGTYLPNDAGNIFSSIGMIVRENSKIRLPIISYYCKNLIEQEKKKSEVTVIKGTVEYDSKEGANPKITSSGKRSTAKHIKTKYTHEVRFEGPDTIDVIKVYEGSVEVTYMKPDASVDEDMSAKMQKLSQDMLEGKISAEEFQKEMEEFDAYGKNSMDLTKPVVVDEGSKCTVGRNSMKTEPIEPGDQRWWEKY